MSTLSLRRLGHFVAVAETGSIAGAADRLFMSASAVSDSVGELERELAAQLLVRRRGRGVALTPTGEAVLGRARALLGDAAELGELARDAGAGLVGPLAIGCFDTLAPTVLPGLLDDFAAVHPAVALSFAEGGQDELQARLLAGELDVAVMYDMDLSPALERIILDEPRAHAIVGARHPLAAAATVSLEELAALPLILFDASPSTSYEMSLFDARGLVPAIRLRTHSVELTRSLVARSPDGYGILVQRPAVDLSHEGLPVLRREIEPAVPPCPVVLAWPRDHRLSPRARELAAIARRRSDRAAATPAG
jgi:DNA-binding transcriptional LysR family regulator